MTLTLPMHFTLAASVFKSACFALLAGSRTIPLGDNGVVIKELAAVTARQRTLAEIRDPFRKV